MKKRKIGKKILTAFLIILAVLIGAGAFYCYAPIIKNDVGDSGLIEKSTDENNLSIIRYNGSEYISVSQNYFVESYVDFGFREILSACFLISREPQRVERLYYEEWYSLAQKHDDDKGGYCAIGDILTGDNVVGRMKSNSFQNAFAARSDIKIMEFKPENIKSVSLCSGSLGERDIEFSAESFDTAVKNLSGDFSEDELKILKTYTDDSFISDFVATLNYSGTLKELYDKIKGDIDGEITAARVEFKDESYPFSLIFNCDAINPMLSIDINWNSVYPEHGADLNKLDVCDKDIEDFGKAAFPKQAQANGEYNLKKSDIEKISGKLYTRSEYDSGYYCVLRFNGDDSRYLFLFFNQNDDLIDTLYYNKWVGDYQLEDLIPPTQSTLKEVKEFLPEIALQNNGAQLDSYILLNNKKLCHITFDSKTQSIKSFEYLDSFAAANLSEHDKESLSLN